LGEHSTRSIEIRASDAGQTPHFLVSEEQQKARTAGRPSRLWLAPYSTSMKSCDRDVLLPSREAVQQQQHDKWLGFITSRSSHRADGATTHAGFTVAQTLLQGLTVAIDCLPPKRSRERSYFAISACIEYLCVGHAMGGVHNGTQRHDTAARGVTRSGAGLQTSREEGISFEYGAIRCSKECETSILGIVQPST
jgi:hypothetical protein